MEILVAPSAQAVIDQLAKGRKSDPARARKVAKVIRLLAEDPHHPSLQSHRYENLDATFGEKIWESYVEQHTPSAWRIWWFFGPGNEQITIVDLGPHP